MNMLATVLLSISITSLAVWRSPSSHRIVRFQPPQRSGAGWLLSDRTLWRLSAKGRSWHLEDVTASIRAVEESEGLDEYADLAVGEEGAIWLLNRSCDLLRSIDDGATWEHHELLLPVPEVCRGLILGESSLPIILSGEPGGQWAPDDLVEPSLLVSTQIEPDLIFVREDLPVGRISTFDFLKKVESTWFLFAENTLLCKRELESPWQIVRDFTREQDPVIDVVPHPDGGGLALTLEGRLQSWNVDSVSTHTPSRASPGGDLDLIYQRIVPGGRAQEPVLLEGFSRSDLTQFPARSTSHLVLYDRWSSETRVLLSAEGVDLAAAYDESGRIWVWLQSPTGDFQQAKVLSSADHGVVWIRVH